MFDVELEDSFVIGTSCPTRSLVYSSLIKDLWRGAPRSKINQRATSLSQKLLITEKKKFASILAGIDIKSKLAWISKIKNQSSLENIVLAIKFKAKTYASHFSLRIAASLFLFSLFTALLCLSVQVRAPRNSLVVECIEAMINFGWYSPKWVHLATS